ncbi:MAG: endonuclease/exonuclease/phosphatase family protein [Verrucomicrobiota bacterium]
MKIATWNVDRVSPGYGARSERIRRAIEDVETDVWVLTETHPDFTPGDGFERAAVSATAPDRKGVQCWVAIWVRKDWDSAELTLTGQPERSAACLLRRTIGKPIIIFGCVLPWRSDVRHSVLRGGEAFAHAIEAHSADWNHLRMKHPEAVFCLAGDLNQELNANGPVGTKRGRDALDEALGLGDRDIECITGGDLDPLVAKGWPASIDHIAIGPGLQIVPNSHYIWPDHYPLQKTMSDHHGVRVELTDT